MKAPELSARPHAEDTAGSEACSERDQHKWRLRSGSCASFSSFDLNVAASEGEVACPWSSFAEQSDRWVRVENSRYRACGHINVFGKSMFLLTSARKVALTEPSEASQFQV